MAVEIFLLPRLAEIHKSLSLVYITHVALECPGDDRTGVNSMPRHIKDMKNQAFHENFKSDTARETWAGIAQSV